MHAIAVKLNCKYQFFRQFIRHDTLFRPACDTRTQTRNDPQNTNELLDSSDQLNHLNKLSY